MGFKRVFDAIGEEESVSKSLPMPQFKYRETLNMWFVMEDGRTYQIGTADIADLIAFLSNCSVGMKAKIVRRDLLKMLEADSSPEARFYALNEFKHYKCPMKLYASEEDARNSLICYTHQSEHVHE